MTNNLKPVKDIQKKTDLEAQINTLDLPSQINLVLTTPWEKRFELITASQQAGQIVANMPVEELFWTIKATGIEDSAIVLGLATPEQLQFVFDLDWWYKDHLRPEKIAAWLLVMFELAEGAAKSWLKWMLNRDPWLFPAVLNEFVKVVKRPDEMDIQEAKDVLPPFTLDNVYFIDFKKKKLAPLFIRLMTTLVEIDPGRYRDILETILWETPSHNLETAFRLRCGRLGDFGVPDYYESLDIYIPLSEKEMHTICREGSVISRLPVCYDLPAFVPTLYVSGYPVLEEAVRRLAGRHVMERIVRETTWVANKVLMADLVDLDDPESLKKALGKAFSLINLGLEKLSTILNKSPEEILETRYPEEIARFSSGLLLPIGAKARKIKSQAYFKALPHMFKDVIEAASLRPSELFDQGAGVSQPVTHLSDLEKLGLLIHQALSWSKITKFLVPSFEKWPAFFDWEKTNFLAPEELAADSALATAMANLLIKAKFQVIPLNKRELQRLHERLTEFDERQVSDILLDLLEPLCVNEEDGLNQKELKEAIIPRLGEIFSEFIQEEGRNLGEPRFIKNLLVEV